MDDQLFEGTGVGRGIQKREDRAGKGGAETQERTTVQRNTEETETDPYTDRSTK